MGENWLESIDLTTGKHLDNNTSIAVEDNIEHYVATLQYIKNKYKIFTT